MGKVKTLKDDILERELELYRKYYEVDEENRIVHIVLHYETADELLEKDVSTFEKPQVKHEILERMSDLVRNIPETYRCDISLEIKDYQGYSSEKLMEAMKDSIEFARYKSDKEIKRNWVVASLFVLIGLIILLIAAFLSTDSIDWMDSTNGAIVKEILDIAAWVFIWEAVTILFISPNPERVVESSLRLRLRSLIFSKPNETGLVSEGNSYLLDFNPWKKGQRKRIGRYLLLISGFLMIATGIANMFFLFTSLAPTIHALLNGNTIENSTLTREGLMALVISLFICSIILLGVRILGGAAGVSRFIGRGRLQKFVAPYSIIMLIYHMVVFVGLALGGASSAIGSWLSSGLGLIMNLTYITGYFLDRFE